MLQANVQWWCMFVRVLLRFFVQVGHENLPKWWADKKGHIFRKWKYVFKKSKILKASFTKSWSPRIQRFFLERFNQLLALKNDFENQNFEMFEEVVHNLGKSDNDMIYWKNAYFH